MESLPIGLVGFGSIGQVIAGSLKSGEIPGVSLSAVIVQRERSERPPELGSALLTTNIKDIGVYCVFVCFDVIVYKRFFSPVVYLSDLACLKTLYGKMIPISRDDH